MAAADPEHRSRNAKIASLTRWSREDPAAFAQAGQAALLARFEREVDPDSTLTPVERARRAEAARKAHMIRLAAKSVAARKAKKLEPKPSDRSAEKRAARAALADELRGEAS